jgi:steroid delta-isomerase-like uncharacterized protein
MSTEENKALIRRYWAEVWNEHDLGALDGLVASDSVLHTPPPALPPGPEGFRQYAGMYLSAFPDARVTVDQMVAEGDLVVTHWTGRGTHTGELMGIAPTGKRSDVQGVTIDRVAGDRIAEEWTYFQETLLMQQLGVMPAPGQAG